MPKDAAKENVLLSGVLPGVWARHAEKLRRSAELLWEPVGGAVRLAQIARETWTADELDQYDHSFAFLFVAGASLETMLKAAAIQAKMNIGGFDAVLTTDCRLQPWLTIHNLVTLAGHAKMIPSAAETAQLSRFSIYVKWAGRYPAPKDLIDQRPNAVMGIDINLTDSDRLAFDQLYARAHETYQQHVREGRWPTPGT
jgi:hypothetical protein